MQAKQHNDVFELHGDISESGDFDDVNPTTQSVTLDFAGVTRLSSIGVQAWLKWLRRNKSLTITYRNCPEILLDMLNMVPDLVRNNVVIESFYVPAFCETCQSAKRLLLTTGVHFHSGTQSGPAKDLTTPDRCERPDCTIEFDVDTETFFTFLYWNSEEKLPPNNVT